MPNLPSISQVFIPNKKQSLDYVSLYEEKIGSDNPIYLFIITEIKGTKKSPSGKNEADFDKLTESIARILKRTYLNEIRTTPSTFEKALENINRELSDLARNGLTGWYKKLNALVAVLYKNEAHVSVTGNASSFLLRENEFTHITESISSGSKPHPLKTFVNFASGTLTKDDVVILSTANLYNYVSLEKLRNVFSDNGLEEGTKDIIATIKKDSNAMDAFSSFIIKITPQARIPDHDLEPLFAANTHTIIEDTPIDTRRVDQTIMGFKKITEVIKKIALGAVAVSSWIYKKIFQPSQKGKTSEYSYLTEKKSPKKKILLIIFVILAFFLIVNIIFSNFRRAESTTKKEMEALLESSALNTTEAEAALIYDDQNGALSSILKAKEQIEIVLASSFLQTEASELSQKINKLYDQLNKITTVTPESLTTFTISPDQIVKSNTGFIGFNSFTDGFEEYISSSGGTNLLLLNKPNETNLTSSVNTDGSTLFFSDKGAIYSIDEGNTNLFAVSPTSTLEDSTLNTVGFGFYTGRLYVIDKNNSQILRYSSSGNTFGNASNWLAEPYDFSNARDLAVDGSIYVLDGNNIALFTQGVKQEFSLPPLAENIGDAKKIFTSVDSQFIYILDAGSKRILVITKQGTLAAQLTSEKFTDLKDMYIDDGSKIIYLLNGNELLRFNY